jgi:hypothetical protein
VPGTPSDLKTALSEADKLAYGGKGKITDDGYWNALWQKDPTYAWKRMLGWQAGGADAPTSGPYSGAATPPSTTPKTTPPAPSGFTPEDIHGGVTGYGPGALSYRKGLNGEPLPWDDAIDSKNGPTVAFDPATLNGLLNPYRSGLVA